MGTYLLVATLNRCLAPCSKASIEQWFQTTALRRLLNLRPEQLSSQRFWDNMDRVNHEALERIEADLVAHLVREFAVDVRRLLFEILDELGRVREITVLYPSGQPGNPPTLHTTLSEMNERQRDLFAALGLDRYRAP